MKGENVQMKPEEQRVLGILATIFGAIALLGSWIPFINYLSFFIAIIALILGIIGLIVNLKKRKTMAIIGTSLAVASVVLFFTTQVLYANVYKEFVREFNRSYSEASTSMEREEESDLTDDSAYSIPEEEEADTFTWTQEQFDALIEGDLDNKGKGGTNYKDIIKKHGLPNSEFDSIIEGYDTKKITYIGIDDRIKTVTLTFVKQDNGQLLLVHKIAVGLGESQQQRDSDSGTRV
ncbi:CD20-like domain-containing protein [Streptococcus oralis]|uniref:CD20-like domain-containing protein n=1 Tax=Streptococcus oralis TaxID=1303 RepID=UPI00300E9F74